MLRQGVTNASPRCKRLCNGVADRCLPKVQKDNNLNISCLCKRSKTRVFPSKSLLADFHAILALFRRIIIRNFHAKQNSRNCMKDKSHPQATFKWSRVDEGLLLSAFSAPKASHVYRIVRTYILTLQR